LIETFFTHWPLSSKNDVPRQHGGEDTGDKNLWRRPLQKHTWVDNHPQGHVLKEIADAPPSKKIHTLS
jgi:hypothetical protein